jgi:TRAP-type mannitol/chloroaromatic compound transport system permease small subunit
VGAFVQLSRAIDGVTGLLGRWVSWLVLVAILVSAGNAIVRKLWDTSSNAWLELQWLLFGAVFLLAAPWTLARNEHIRIDVARSRFPPWLRSAVELAGSLLFLIPVTTVLVVTSWPVFLASAPRLSDLATALEASDLAKPLDALGRILAIGEQSANAGGLPLWPAKLLIPLGFALVLLQAVSELCKRLAIIGGALQEPGSSGHPAYALTEPLPHEVIGPDGGGTERSGPRPTSRGKTRGG